MDRPQSNHNAGQIAFGPDGYLYIPLGDGGAADVSLGHVEDWYDVNEGGNGQGSDGEVYVLTSGTAGPAGDTGRIYKIVPAGS